MADTHTRPVNIGAVMRDMEFADPRTERLVVEGTRDLGVEAMYASLRGGAAQTLTTRHAVLGMHNTP